MNVKNIMNDEVRGLCLCLGFAGLAYVAFLLLLAAFTGFKIVKGLSLLIAFSAGLICLGFKPQVRNRVYNYARCVLLK
ncbi:MAG: hypothetical protein JKY88_01745 [Pseudomonadales bacterium]|nr:hypothetical protein [Pseudomonadales bacterium]